MAPEQNHPRRNTAPAGGFLLWFVVRLMEERRIAPRRKVLKAGTIAFGRSSVIDCLIRNLSDKGASLEVESQIGIPETFTLVIPHDAIMRVAHVQWRSAKRIGIVFD
jgi:hypothetical protein